MTTYYNVEIQMAGDNKATQDFIEQFATNFGADKTDIDEIESHRAVLFFKSETLPTDMRQIIRAVLLMYGSKVHYIDVIYRYEAEMTPDRFCIWSDGHEQEYTGKVIFKEDK